MGEEQSQKKISVLESKEEIEDELLAEIAQILRGREKAIRNFDEETAIYNIQNNYEGSSVTTVVYINAFSNQLDKLIETVEKLKKLHAEKEALFERLSKAQ